MTIYFELRIFIHLGAFLLFVVIFFIIISTTTLVEVRSFLSFMNIVS